MKEKIKNIFINVLLVTIISFGIVHGSSLITNTNQTASNGDTITAAWVNDVNSKLNSIGSNGGFFDNYITIHSSTARVNDKQHCFTMEYNGFISVRAGGVGRLYVNGTLVGYNTGVSGRDHDGNVASQVVGVARMGDNVCARTGRARAGYNSHLLGGADFTVQVAYWR